MGCGCGGGARSAGRYNITRRTPRATGRPVGSGAKPRKQPDAGNFVVYRRDGSQTTYPGDRSGERAAMREAADKGLPMDWVPNKKTVTETPSSKAKKEHRNKK